MWYNRLSEYLLKMRYSNDSICPCIFIKKFNIEFAIITVYVDNLNIIKTLEEVQKAVTYLKEEFEMKNLDKTKYYLDLQIEYVSSRIFIYQSAYTEKVLKHFYMDKAHPLRSPMVERLLDLKNDSFRSKEEEEELLNPKVSYLSIIGALIYLANYIRSDIVFGRYRRWRSSYSRRTTDAPADDTVGVIVL